MEPEPSKGTLRTPKTPRHPYEPQEISWNTMEPQGTPRTPKEHQGTPRNLLQKIVHTTQKMYVHENLCTALIYQPHESGKVL